jgi:hypothetical protein
MKIGHHPAALCGEGRQKRRGCSVAAEAAAEAIDRANHDAADENTTTKFRVMTPFESRKIPKLQVVTGQRTSNIQARNGK